MAEQLLISPAMNLSLANPSSSFHPKLTRLSLSFLLPIYKLWQVPLLTGMLPLFTLVLLPGTQTLFLKLPSLNSSHQVNSQVFQLSNLKIYPSSSVFPSSWPFLIQTQPLLRVCNRSWLVPLLPVFTLANLFD